MNKINIYNQTEEKIDIPFKKIKSVLKYTLKRELINNAICNIIIIDNAKIQQINYTYRHINAPTDVLSFALEEENMINPTNKRILGDVYISIDKVKEQSLKFGHSELRELTFLGIHGLLHLLGYDHLDEESEKIMIEKQMEVLNKHGIKR